MQCPVCKVTLLMSEKHGVEIDYCPQCRGVWLDRGELEKILDHMKTERSSRLNISHEPERNYRDHAYEAHHQDTKHTHSPHENRRYKKKSKFDFLSDIFEFGD